MPAKSQILKSITDYKIDPMQGPTRRAAAFLDWCAKEFPLRPVQYAVVVKIAFTLPRTPKDDSKEVVSFQKTKMGTVKNILLRDYRRGVLTIPGLGVRATIDSEDAMAFVIQKSNRVKGAIRILDAARSIVEPKDVKNKFLREQLSRIDKGMESLPDLMRQLELPALPEQSSVAGAVKHREPVRRPVPNSEEDDD